MSQDPHNKVDDLVKKVPLIGLVKNVEEVRKKYPNAIIKLMGKDVLGDIGYIITIHVPQDQLHNIRNDSNFMETEESMTLFPNSTKGSSHFQTLL